MSASCLGCMSKVTTSKPNSLSLRATDPVPLNKSRALPLPKPKALLFEAGSGGSVGLAMGLVGAVVNGGGGGEDDDDDDGGGGVVGMGGSGVVGPDWGRHPAW